MMFDFGLNLKYLRKECNYTQKQLATILDVTTPTILNWENNYKYPSINYLITLSKLYGVTLDYICGIDKNRSIVINNMTPEEKELLYQLVEHLGGRKDTGKDTVISMEELNIISSLERILEEKQN